MKKRMTLPETVDHNSPRWVISDALMAAYDNGTSPNAVREADFLIAHLDGAGYEVRRKNDA